MLTFPISEDEINDYFDIISHKYTFITLKSIYLQRETTSSNNIEKIDNMISFYENSRRQWWTDILNKHNYPFFPRKKTYISRTRGCIVVE